MPEQSRVSEGVKLVVVGVVTGMVSAGISTWAQQQVLEAQIQNLESQIDRVEKQVNQIVRDIYRPRGWEEETAGEIKPLPSTPRIQTEHHWENM